MLSGANAARHVRAAGDSLVVAAAALSSPVSTQARSPPCACSRRRRGHPLSLQKQYEVQMSQISLESSTSTCVSLLHMHIRVATWQKFSQQITSTLQNKNWDLNST
jgi:hypothetical protein